MLAPVITPLCPADPVPKVPNSSLAFAKLEPASPAVASVEVWIWRYSFPIRSRNVPLPAGARFSRSSAKVSTALFSAAL